MMRREELKPPLAFGIWVLTWVWWWTEPAFMVLWPSIAALSIVFLLRRVILGLLAGATSGAVLLSDGNPFFAFLSFFTDHLIPSLQSGWNISVLIFTLLLGGFVALIEYGGGLRDILRRFLQTGSNAARRVQWSAFGMGLVCFFDGLANSMLVGRMSTPLAVNAGVSREKMAYLVDSTSSAVACVAFISTWIAYQISMIHEGYAQVGQTTNAYLLFLQSLPYNFYCWFTLLLLVVVIRKNWNIGPMAAAERAGESREPIVSEHTGGETSWLRAFIPLGVLIGALLGGLYFDGAEQPFPVTMRKLADAFGTADAAMVLVCASAFACIVAYLFNRKGVTAEKPEEAFMRGVTTLFTPALILISAWALSSTLRELEAAPFLATLLAERLPAGLLPGAVFIVGMAVAFTTGTSWGTMGVLMPLALPVALTLTAGMPSADAQVIIAGTVAAVFGGAVFGDHCSPLSDTTIVSSLACGLEPMDHVRTQLPYALTTAAITILLGYLPVGLGVPVWLVLPAGAVVIWLLPAVTRRLSGSA